MKILFCCDGSSPAEKAARFGVQMAAACQAETAILGIAERVEDEESLLKRLQSVQRIFRAHDVDAELITEIGRPVREIVRHTEKIHCDLVVIGAAPKVSFWQLYNPVWMSVRVYNIIESIEPPVLVVIGNPRSLRRILLCTGGAEYIDRAVEFAGKIAQAMNAVVDLVHVMPEAPAMYADLVRFEEDVGRTLASDSKLGKALRNQKSLLEKFNVFGDLRLRQGDVVPELIKELKRAHYDLVVSGSLPARERLRKYVIGDVAREIVNRAEVPVLVVRTGQRIQIWRLFKELLAGLFRRSRQTSDGSKN